MAESEKTIGPLQWKFAENALWIDQTNADSKPLRLDAEHLDELIDFLFHLRDQSANRRQVYRVPLWHTCGLAAKLKVGETVFDCAPRNISLTGVFLALPDDALVAPGVRVEVALYLDDLACVFDGEIVRIEGDHCGIIFPELVDSDRAEPPETLAAMVMELQRRLLKRAW